MTIRKGEAWGSTARAPHDLRIAHDDEALACAVSRGATHLGVAKSDLLRTVGRHESARIPDIGLDAILLPCDAMEVTLDDRPPIIAVSQVLIGTLLRPRWWLTAGGFVGSLNVAPRAHPNDGLVDALGFADRIPLRTLWQIRRRMLLGDHLPHPRLTMHRGAALEWHDDARSERVRIDGKHHPRAHRVQVKVRRDAWVLCIASDAEQ